MLYVDSLGNEVGGDQKQNNMIRNGHILDKRNVDVRDTVDILYKKTYNPEDSLDKLGKREGETNMTGNILDNNKGNIDSYMDPIQLPIKEPFF